MKSVSCSDHTHNPDPLADYLSRGLPSPRLLRDETLRGVAATSELPRLDVAHLPFGLLLELE